MALQRIGSLPSLPGGNAHYLSTLAGMLAWIEKRTITSRRDFTDWVVASQDVARSSVNNYVQTLFRLGVVEKASTGDYMQLSEHGKAFLSARTNETRASILLAVLMPAYEALHDILNLFAEAAEPLALDDIHTSMLDRYPAWNSGFPLAERVYWLLSLGCIQQIGNRRVYAITAFGRTVAHNYDAPSEHAPVTLSAAEKLGAELRHAAVDGDHPRSFELAAAAAMGFLGYQIEHYGQAGTADVLGRAVLGSASYSFILDSKARSSGVLQTIEAYTLQEHREKYRADYVVILAADYGGEKIQRLAQSERISLWTVPMLCEWLLVHEQMPQDLLAYRTCFMQFGVLNTLPGSLQQALDVQARRAALIQKVIALMQESYRRQVQVDWTATVLHSHLAMGYPEQRFTFEEVVSALELLSHPALGGVHVVDETFVATMDYSTLIHRLRTIADFLQKI